MAENAISKNKIPDFLKAVTADYEFYGPKSEDGIINFGKIDTAEQLVLDFRNSNVSAKELFLPRTEVVYEFDGKDFVNDKLPDEKRIIFGVRPCDCRALTMLDKIFDTEEIKDPFYVTRRQNSVVIALACNEPLGSCFCTELGGEPFGNEGADILMAEDGDNLAAKAITDKGKDFLAKYSKLFSGKSSINFEKQAKQAKDSIKSKLSITGLKKKLDESFEDDKWESVSQQCLGCGVCSCLCPTCYCFDLVDEKTAAGGIKKVRTWDWCMAPLFTKHASGHNPRSVNSARLRQKVMHKFSYYPERYGIDSCVGCGRCVRNCPVNLDIREVLGQLNAATKT